jgi:hypothetical protein
MMWSIRMMSTELAVHMVAICSQIWRLAVVIVDESSKIM